MTTPLVGALLDALGLEEAPVQTLARYDLDVLRCPKAQRAHHITKLVLREHLKRIQRHFDHKIPFILLKGEPLERLLFGGASPRGTGDLDLLVLPDDFERACVAIKELGFIPLLDEAPRRWAQNQLAIIHHRQNIVVELHWACALPGVPDLPLKELFKTSQPFAFDQNLTVSILRPDWLFFHLAIHFHHHLGFAKGLLDIAAWCDRYAQTCDLEALNQRAKKLGLHGLIQWPLHTLARLVGPRSMLPQMIDNNVGPAVHLWSRLSAKVLRNCLQKSAPGELEAALNGVMHDLDPLRGLSLQALSMLLIDGWPNQLRGLLRPFLLGPHRLGQQVSLLRSALER